MPPTSAATDILGRLLAGVSRSFYLTLRVLPPALREPVGLAYLLARAADTVADTGALAADERRAWLERLRLQLGEPDAAAAAALAGDAAGAGASELERELLRALPRILARLPALAPFDRQRVGDVVATLSRGMDTDLETFGAAGDGHVVPLPGAVDLDRYTFAVAGCVGEFWTLITVAHTPCLAGWDVAAMTGLGVRLGKGLQLVNVLRDAPGDLRAGRCYLPADELAALGLEPADLLRPGVAEAARPLLERWMRVALEHLAAGERYLLAIPRPAPRLRLAVLWPLLLAQGTLERLARSPDWPASAQPARVGRGWVYRMLVTSALLVFSDRVLAAWISRSRRRVLRALRDGEHTAAPLATE